MSDTREDRSNVTIKTRLHQNRRRRRHRLAGSDLIGDLLAQTPPGRVLDSKFKGLSDIALKEAKAPGCSYADIRFTRTTNSGVNANGGNPGSRR